MNELASTFPHHSDLHHTGIVDVESVHVAPLLHGLDKHSSMSNSQSLVLGQVLVHGLVGGYPIVGLVLHVDTHHLPIVSPGRPVYDERSNPHPLVS